MHMEKNTQDIFLKMERVRRWEESGELISRSDLEYLDTYMDGNAEVEQ